jgi:hypothetical protein
MKQIGRRQSELAKGVVLQKITNYDKRTGVLFFDLKTIDI